MFTFVSSEIFSVIIRNSYDCKWSTGAGLQAQVQRVEERDLGSHPLFFFF